MEDIKIWMKNTSYKAPWCLSLPCLVVVPKQTLVLKSIGNYNINGETIIDKGGGKHWRLVTDNTEFNNLSSNWVSHFTLGVDTYLFCAVEGFEPWTSYYWRRHDDHRAVEIYSILVNFGVSARGRKKPWAREWCVVCLTRSRRRIKEDDDRRLTHSRLAFRSRRLWISIWKN